MLLLSLAGHAADLIRRARVRMHPEKNRRAGDARIRQADFYVPVATGIFKSAAKIAFLEAARGERHSHREASPSRLSFFFKVLSELPELPAENTRFVRRVSSPLSPERAIARDKRGTIVSIARRIAGGTNLDDGSFFPRKERANACSSDDTVTRSRGFRLV